ncbi:hypothetical protein BV898_00127 [Hypsibius exemplaris]|uniref:Glycine zipper domain-containing protein n=1 Tax=Hypsibius exemplaris TaxID=2072580 RepID=A0A1W0XF56_HYPEX|nr:hypothetical protein BV898_00127 [Hypsibius exemplaris]
MFQTLSVFLLVTMIISANCAPVLKTRGKRSSTILSALEGAALGAIVGGIVPGVSAKQGAAAGAALGGGTSYFMNRKKTTTTMSSYYNNNVSLICLPLLSSLHIPAFLVVKYPKAIDYRVTILRSNVRYPSTIYSVLQNENKTSAFHFPVLFVSKAVVLAYFLQTEIPQQGIRAGWQ